MIAGYARVSTVDQDLSAQPALSVSALTGRTAKMVTTLKRGDLAIVTRSTGSDVHQGRLHEGPSFGSEARFLHSSACLMHQFDSGSLTQGNSYHSRYRPAYPDICRLAEFPGDY
jgi:hypothetical protein